MQRRPTSGISIPGDQSRFVGNKSDPLVGQFLGGRNRELVHRLIIKYVHDSTGGRVKLGRQSDNDLYVLMIRLLQDNYHTGPTLQELNRLAVLRCSDIIMGNVASYMQYVRDTHSGAPSEMDVPANSRDSREVVSRPVF
tara:strand:+ start:61 stop:477 length:417 start_codon:yes stop_codon:yes gene_type:complete